MTHTIHHDFPHDTHVVSPPGDETYFMFIIVPLSTEAGTIVFAFSIGVSRHHIYPSSVYTFLSVSVKRRLYSSRPVYTYSCTLFVFLTPLIYLFLASSGSVASHCAPHLHPRHRHVWRNVQLYPVRHRIRLAPGEKEILRLSRHFQEHSCDRFSAAETPR